MSAEEEEVPAESSFDLAVDAICDLVEGADADDIPSPTMEVEANEEEEEAQPTPEPVAAAPPVGLPAPPAAPSEAEANHERDTAAEANGSSNTEAVPPTSSTSKKDDPLIGKKSAEGEVYINKDGKKVRRVKRSEKRMRQRQQDTTAKTEAVHEPTPAPTPAGVPSHVKANQKAQSEAEAQRAAAAAASAALLGAAPPAPATHASDPEPLPILDDAMLDDAPKATPTLSFEHDDANSSEDNADDYGEEDDGGDWDLNYKTGLARHHEDAERQMLEGEEGRRGFESSDDEEDDDYEEEDRTYDEYQDGGQDTAIDDASFDNAADQSTFTDTNNADVVVASERGSATMMMPVDNHQEAVSVSNTTTNVAPAPGLIEDPASTNPVANNSAIAHAPVPVASEDMIMDPGDIRAALSSASGGGHVIAENHLNQFDPLAPGSTPSNPVDTVQAMSGVAAPLSHPYQQPPNNITGVSATPYTAMESPGEPGIGHGPLWQQAGQIAAAQQQYSTQEIHSHHQHEKMSKRAAIGQTIRDECWSRAAVDAGEVAPDTLIRAESRESFAAAAAHNAKTERVATKRVNVVQLLINGLIGLVGGLFGSIYVQTACHFVTVDVGMQLHFGLWQYSPMDSAFQGFTYCYPYDTDYTNDSPLFARIAGLLALIAGSFSISVLWVYLLLGRTSNILWKWGVRFLVVAASFQALTFSFFAEDVCRRNSCSVGPGSIVSLVSTLSWILVAYEMKHNSPFVTPLISDPHQERMSKQKGGGGGGSGEGAVGVGVELTTGYRPPVSLGVNV